jgi:hypothetical protein
MSLHNVAGNKILHKLREADEEAGTEARYTVHASFVTVTRKDDMKGL